MDGNRHGRWVPLLRVEGFFRWLGYIFKRIVKAPITYDPFVQSSPDVLCNASCVKEVWVCSTSRTTQSANADGGKMSTSEIIRKVELQPVQ
jgi:hypothetical protein